MSDFTIHVEDLSKKYQICGKREGYRTLRETLTDAFVSPFRKTVRLLRGETTGGAGSNEIIWALKDVSFEVKHGEVVGIIGHNGAGKSTLLKILSRITEPTEGYAEIHGRVGSLLEVGTGFHPELTGRENVHLNGAILGMKRGEIERKFDEIIAFAEVEKFVDTPVKHYSSGMYLRLAFAVAAHLEPEILLVDEVLAVGDAAFQKKCLGKMGDVARAGRAVLFVSHNMVAVQSLCDRVVRLHQGMVVEEGQADRVVSGYLQTSFSTLTEQYWADLATAPGNDKVRLHRVGVRPVHNPQADPISIRTPLVMEFEYWNLRPHTHLDLSFHLYNEHGVIVFNSGTICETVRMDRPFPAGLFRSVCHIPGDLLNDGVHRVQLQIVENEAVVISRFEDILVFNVSDTQETRGRWYGKWPGAVRPTLKWSTELVKETNGYEVIQAQCRQ
jgi:homopolymeric O-antigen transport system ATP-binding protein